LNKEILIEKNIGKERRTTARISRQVR